MPRLNATQGQSYVIGGSSSGDKGASDLPRFERPALKQARSAYSSTSPRPKSSSSIALETAGHGRGFFGRNKNNSSSDALPLTSSSTSPTSAGNNTSNAAAGSIRSKMRAAVSGRDSGRDALPDWSRSAPSPSNSFNTRQRTHSDAHLNMKSPQHTMSASLQHDRDYDSNDEDTRFPRRSSDTISLNHQHHHLPTSSSSSSHLHHLPHHAASSITSSHHDQQMSIMETQQSSGSTTNGSRVLRQRKPDYPPSPHGSVAMSTPGRQRHPNRASSGSSIPEDSPYRPHGNSSRSNRSHWMVFHKLRATCGNIRGWNIGHFLQVTVGLLVTFLLYDSHHKANLIAQRLKEFKSEEAMVFLHLHRIEQQSIQLHESLQDLDPSQLQNHGGGGGGKKVNNNEGGEYLTENNHNNKHLNNPTPHIDSALIQKQTQQLLQMEEELSHEVRTLQTRIQHSAVRSIVHEYGEGPVQVILEVVVDGQTSKISILLWHDTPHAAWTWLEQISQRLWDGAVIHLENNRIMNVASTREETAGARLDFVERSQQRHEAWTVGLVESSSVGGSGQGVGGLELFINLQDNTDFSKHDVCVGKVFDGFDVLHKIVDESRELQQAGGQAITIRTARASHLTNRETKGLI